MRIGRCAVFSFQSVNLLQVPIYQILREKKRIKKSVIRRSELRADPCLSGENKFSTDLSTKCVYSFSISFQNLQTIPWMTF